MRHAFSYATDRAQIVKGILKGYGTEAYSPLQKHAFNNENIEKYNFDIERQKNCLDEAGWKEDRDGFRYKDGGKLSVYDYSTCIRFSSCEYGELCRRRI